MPATRRSARNAGQAAPPPPPSTAPASKSKKSSKITFSDDFDGYASEEEASTLPQKPATTEDTDSESDVEEVQNNASKESALNARTLERLASKSHPSKKKKKKKKSPDLFGDGTLSSEMLAAVSLELEKRRAALLSDISSEKIGDTTSNSHTKFTYSDDSEKVQGVVADDTVEVVWERGDEGDDDGEAEGGGKKKKKKKAGGIFKLHEDSEAFEPMVDEGADSSELVSLHRLESVKKRAKFKR
ncbi:hypothetical protein TrVE_jg6605 [Triparma verrucosa]|uniref:Uncharacterized protein n=1 Tax=Triparma verrucosa TaxID=1606542 RepID=A0A9W7BV50_9STRA|nr:hypothetical protein TrVE_jg6605 [Triparma verrucosa]